MHEGSRNVERREMAIFTAHKSKRESLAGVWIDDDALGNCMVCDAKYGMLMARKHHCRVSAALLRTGFCRDG